MPSSGDKNLLRTWYIGGKIAVSRRTCWPLLNMSSVEYLFAAHIDLADAFAKVKGWRAYGRAQWQKRDGCVVYCLCLLVQLEIVSAGETVHFIGYDSEALRVLKRRKAICICYEVESAA
jgi:hypothetical protein